MTRHNFVPAKIDWNEVDEANHRRYLRKIAQPPQTLNWTPALLAGQREPISAQAEQMHDAATMWQS